MTVVLARVDERLVHGVTVNQWNRELHPKRYMVVDNEISKNEMIKATMRMSKPAGTGMSIIDEEKAITNFNNGKYDSHAVFILVKEPETLLNMIRVGVKIPAVNLGAMFEENDRKSFTSRIAMDDKEIEDLKKIQELGVKIYAQYTPDDEKILLDDLLKKGE